MEFKKNQPGIIITFPYIPSLSCLFSNDLKNTKSYISVHLLFCFWPVSHIRLKFVFKIQCYLFFHFLNDQNAGIKTKLYVMKQCTLTLDFQGIKM